MLSVEDLIKPVTTMVIDFGLFTKNASIKKSDLFGPRVFIKKIIDVFKTLEVALHEAFLTYDQMAFNRNYYRFTQCDYLFHTGILYNHP